MGVGYLQSRSRWQKHRQLLALLLFKLSWLLLVLKGNNDLVLLFTGLLITGIGLCVIRSPLVLLTAGCITLSGLILDTTLTLTGNYQFAANTFVVLPVWLLLLWLAFSLVLADNLALLRRIPQVPRALLLGTAGITGYGAACLLGAVSYPRGIMPTLLLVFLCWTALADLWTRFLLPVASPQVGKAATKSAGGN